MEGRIMRRLREALEKEGFYDVTLWAMQGHWRTSRYADVMPWEGLGKSRGRKDFPDGMPVNFGSWDTMTACVQGFKITRDGGTFFDISACQVKRSCT